jgi:hypothetical protein
MSNDAADISLEVMLPLHGPLRLAASTQLSSTGDATGIALWPAGVALAAAMSAGLVAAPPRLGDLLDLGCGCGVAGIAAARCLGLPATLADREPRALERAAANAAANGVPATLLQLDWERPPPRRWPLILAADPCYLPGAAPRLVAFLAAALPPTPDALAVIADPDRWEARHLAYHAAEAGFAVAERLARAPGVNEHGPVRALAPEAEGVSVRLYELRRRDH